MSTERLAGDLADLARELNALETDVRKRLGSRLARIGAAIGGHELAALLRVALALMAIVADLDALVASFRAQGERLERETDHLVEVSRHKTAAIDGLVARVEREAEHLLAVSRDKTSALNQIMEDRIANLYDANIAVATTIEQALGQRIDRLELAVERMERHLPAPARGSPRPSM
ncbi:MAG: hypothetical protein NVS3B21_31850 [Acidimicrobiales bacterium]